MGHVHLGVIPRSRPWKAVVELLDAQAADEAVVAASAKAAEADLTSASKDPVYVEAVRLLLTIPHAARSEDFGAALRDADMPVGERPGLLDLVTAVTARLDEVARRSTGRSDMGEIAARAVTGTLAIGIGDRLPGLFEATPDDVQAIAKRMSWSRGISEFTRLFYTRLVSDGLSYWLDRTLAERIGPDQRFRSVADRAAFDGAVLQYADEATRIIQEFAGGWYGKALNEKGGVGTVEAAVFGAVSLKKIVAELRIKRGSDA